MEEKTDGYLAGPARQRKAIDQEIDAARREGELLRRSQPAAVVVRYAPADRRVVIDLDNGCWFAFPVDEVEGLGDAPDAVLADVEITGAGFGLYWPGLDVDLSVPGLLAGLLGTRAWMDRLRAGNAGRATSPAKAAASRRNGARGGRPRKTGADGG